MNMDTFMFYFHLVFALLIGGAMIWSGFILNPNRYDEKPKKAHTKA